MRYYSPLSDKITETPGTWAIPLNREHNAERSENTSFKNRIMFAWDSTSIGLFKTCPRKFYYSVVMGYEPATMAPPLAFGIALHSVMDTWHKLLAANIDKQTAFIRVTRLAGLLGEQLPIGDNTRTKETLVRTTVWFLDQFWDDHLITVKLPSGKAATELHFELPFMEYLGINTFICGHIDRLATWQGKAFVADLKTTKYQLDSRFFEGFKPSTQMSLYITACHLIANKYQELPPAHGVIIDGVQLGVNFSRFGRQVIPYSLEEVNEYIENLQYWIRQAMDACKNNHFPANEESCNKYSGCHFRDICSKPAARRDTFLNGTFKQRTWDPLKPRT